VVGLLRGVDLWDYLHSPWSVSSGDWRSRYWVWAGRAGSRMTSIAPAFGFATTAMENSVAARTATRPPRGCILTVIVPDGKVHEPQELLWEAARASWVSALVFLVAIICCAAIPSAPARVAFGIVGLLSGVLGVYQFVSHEHSQSVVHVHANGLTIIRLGARNSRAQAITVGPPSCIHSVQVWHDDAIGLRPGPEGGVWGECCRTNQRIEIYGIRVLYAPPMFGNRDTYPGDQFGSSALNTLEVFDPEAAGGFSQRIEAYTTETQDELHARVWDMAQQIRSALNQVREGRAVGGDDRPGDVVLRDFRRQQQQLHAWDATVNPLEASAARPHSDFYHQRAADGHDEEEGEEGEEEE